VVGGGWARHLMGELWCRGRIHLRSVERVGGREDVAAGADVAWTLDPLAAVYVALLDVHASKMVVAPAGLVAALLPGVGWTRRTSRQLSPQLAWEGERTVRCSHDRAHGTISGCGCWGRAQNNA
jgi:hypothetical protein